MAECIIKLKWMILTYLVWKTLILVSTHIKEVIFLQWFRNVNNFVHIYVNYAIMLLELRYHWYLTQVEIKPLLNLNTPPPIGL